MIGLILRVVKGVLVRPTKLFQFLRGLGGLKLKTKTTRWLIGFLANRASRLSCSKMRQKEKPTTKETD
mgnify:CR=1 FL=1